MITISEDRLDRMERLLLATMEQTQANAIQMAERDTASRARMDELAAQMSERDAIAHARMDQLTERLDRLTERVDRLTERIDNLTILVAELREGQAMLTQFFTQAQEDQQDFRRWTKVALDRIDRTLQDLSSRGDS